MGNYTVDSNKLNDQTLNSRSGLTIKNNQSTISNKIKLENNMNSTNWPEVIGRNWDKIGSGKFNTAQRGDEESRRNRVYKNFIREKG